MSEKKDLVVKMTINSTDFENGLRSARGEMKQMERSAENSGQTFKSVFGKIAIIVTAASKALDSFNKMIRGTEEGADSADRSMRALNNVTDQFYKSISNGRFFSVFNDGLNDMIKNAREAYDAIDKLSTIKLWGNSRISELQASIEEDRVLINDPKISEEQKKEAQSRIDENMKQIKKISERTRNYAQSAKKAKLREMSNAGDDVTDEMLEEWVKAWEDETFKELTDKFFKAHATLETHSFTMGNQENMYAYEQEYTTEEWDSRKNRRIYNSMISLLTSKEDEAWAEFYSLNDEEQAMRMRIARLENRANNVINKEIKPTGTTPKEMGLTFEQEIERLNRMVFNAPIHTKWDDIIIPTEDLIEEEGIIEEETDAIVDAYTARQNALAELSKETAAAIVTANALGSAFTSIGQIAGDDIFGNIAAGLGNIISQASSTISALMALAGAETVEGLAEVFAEAPPYTKIALTATALAGILSMIASAKSAFAGSFAEGGVVGGNSYTGDKLWARVNSGEMIIPYNDWHNSGTGSGQVKFVIEGSQLKGVLDNYESIQNM